VVNRSNLNGVNEMTNGVNLYRGPSLLNCEPIVAIATGLARASSNEKTGDFIQVAIMGEAVNPMEALFSGADAAVCGSCPLRPKMMPDGTRKLGPCYVNVGRGPRAVWAAFRSGTYPEFDPAEHLDLFRGRLVRLGSYGDPAEVPLSVWETVCGVARHWTGYTHAWRTCDPGYARFCMASVESVEARREALAKGYRTFRVRLPEQPVDEGEFICPASEEAGKRRTCAECKACSGARPGGQAVSPVIIVHGLDWKVSKFRDLLNGGGPGA
jgi:hypothetical protein